MRSYEEPKSNNAQTAPLAQPPFPRRLPSSQARNLRLADEEESRTKRAMLIQEHRDLDAAIAALFEAKSCDHLLITRLKKRKLQLKDEIALIGS